MKTHRQQQTWDENYKKIVDIIKSKDAQGATASEIMNTIKNRKLKALSRQAIHKYLRAAARKDIAKHGIRYFSREYEEKRGKAEKACRAILSLSEDDLSVRAGLPWFQTKLDCNLTQFAPEKYLESGKVIHNDILKRRSKLGDKKRAKLEATVYTDTFLKNIEVEIGTSIKEVELQSGHRLTTIAAFLPFLQKVQKGWDTEVYDKAAWIMYRFFREIAQPCGVSPSDEIVISIRLKPYYFMMRLLRCVYIFKELEAFKYRPSIFPEMQENVEYQALEKTWQAADEKHRQQFLEQDPLLYILDHAKRPKDSKP